MTNRIARRATRTLLTAGAVIGLLLACALGAWAAEVPRAATNGAAAQADRESARALDGEKSPLRPGSADTPPADTAQEPSGGGGVRP